MNINTTENEDVSHSNNYLNEFISGERFQLIADVYLGLNSDVNNNSNLISHVKKKILNITSINYFYDNPSILFCYGHRLPILINYIKYFKNPFVLISHNSDENIDNRYNELIHSDKIIKWFGQNICIVNPKLHILPIGIANSMWNHGNMEILKNIVIKHIEKTKDVYFYFNIETNFSVRNHCKNQIEKKGIQWGSSSEFNDYLINLASYKFSICPEGNGIDCHRTWECYYLKVIPIMLRSPFSEQLNKLLPCILLNEWSDLKIKDILPLYDSLLLELNKNYKYLTIQYYNNEINKIVKDC
jgi:hypothetical protein